MVRAHLKNSVRRGRSPRRVLRTRAPGSLCSRLPLRPTQVKEGRRRVAFVAFPRRLRTRLESAHPSDRGDDGHGVAVCCARLFLSLTCLFARSLTYSLQPAVRRQSLRDRPQLRLRSFWRVSFGGGFGGPHTGASPRRRFTLLLDVQIFGDRALPGNISIGLISRRLSTRKSCQCMTCNGRSFSLRLSEFLFTQNMCIFSSFCYSFNLC